MIELVIGIIIGCIGTNLILIDKKGMEVDLIED